MPGAATRATQEGDNIRADVILAKELERLVRRGLALVSERIETLLSCCHAGIERAAFGQFADA